ncbi:MAG TPA: bifunctional aldolase/short-chain dehydrogenase, partial [Candidatus Eisenbacteria bacterium]|nr:bifunctional aldolase/short-chain dehydrogenase [Candidatus Eisenbacteria bacterium]
SRWNDRDLSACQYAFASRWGEDLALRVYTSRLIGQDPDLVLHGGGNTSLKGTYRTLLGDDVAAIWVKGSGSDLETVTPSGFPAIDLTHLRRLRGLESLSDQQMVNELRTHMFNAGAPNPSVETLLHAFLPHRFIDHTHADAALVLSHQPADLASALMAEAFPGWGVVPYVMPGFKLAKLAAEAYERDPDMPGLVLVNHGLFTFSDDARESYERMIEAVDRAEQVARKRARQRTRVTVSAPSHETVANTALTVRGGLGRAGAMDPGRTMLLEHRDAPDLLEILARPDISALAQTGPLTPDHVLRTKPWPLVWKEGEDLEAAIERYRAEYGRYFTEHVSRVAHSVRKLEGSPRVVLVPGQGLFAWGRTKPEAVMAADIAEHTLRAQDLALTIQSYVPLPEEDLFDVEYWSLEQAKLGTKKDPVLVARIALVTGGTGAIGFAVARALLDAGASVVISDRSEELIQRAVIELDPEGTGRVIGLPAEVTDADSVAGLYRETCRQFGGLDILVHAAGIAHVSKLEDMDSTAFQEVVDVNLTGTLVVLREAAGVFRRQGLGGSVVLVSTKNVFAPGASFGAYSASKAGAHQLARIAAIEWAEMEVRVNMISVDAVFGDERRPSGLWQTVGQDRARAHGVSASELPEFYRRRNLLKAPVTGEQVGRAVVFFASKHTPTTGATLPVDGGLPDAAPR